MAINGNISIVVPLPLAQFLAMVQKRQVKQLKQTLQLTESPETTRFSNLSEVSVLPGIEPGNYGVRLQRPNHLRHFVGERAIYTKCTSEAL
jgi:hypothetical protein